MQNNLQLKSDWQESFTVQQLKDTAKAIGLKNYSKLKKKELIDLIKNSIHNPTIVEYKTENKIEKLERELKQLRLKSERQDKKEQLERERIEKEKIQKEEKEREKYRQVIQKYKNRSWGVDFSGEEQKIIETIAAMRIYQANCSTRQQFIDFCKENNFPVPDINGNF